MKMKKLNKSWLKILVFIIISFMILAIIPGLDQYFEYKKIEKEPKIIDSSKKISHIIPFTISFIIFLILSFKYKKLLKRKSISFILKDILSAKVEGLYGFIGIIFILTLISWFADYFREKDYLLAIASLINIFNVGILFIRFYPLESRRTENTKKVLIMALSEFKGKEESFKEELKKGLLSKERLSSNWELPLRHIYEYQNTLEKVFFITSPQSYEDKEKFWNI